MTSGTEKVALKGPVNRPLFAASTYPSIYMLSGLGSDSTMPYFHHGIIFNFLPGRHHFVPEVPSGSYRDKVIPRGHAEVPTDICQR